MAIAEMSKLRLVGLNAERDCLLDALARTGCVEIKERPLIGDTDFCQSTGIKEIEEKRERLTASIDAVTKSVEAYVRETKASAPGLKDGFDVSYGDFMNASSTEDEVFEICTRAEELLSRVTDGKNQIVRLSARLKELQPYANVTGKLSTYRDTRLAAVRLGTIPAEKLSAFNEYLSGADGVEGKVIPSDSMRATVLLAAHKDFADAALSFLGEIGFERCAFIEDATAEGLIADVTQSIKDTEAQVDADVLSLFEMGDCLPKMKTLDDYYGFILEKDKAVRKFPGTRTAFVLEAYVPKEAQKKVSFAIEGVSDCIYYEFTGIDEKEMPPTLMKNNKVVRNFEFVTNMYTPPNYKEFDPNAVMSIFFAIFLGFIMADIGYGLLMMAIGFIMAKREAKDTGMRRLMLVIGYSGIFTVLFGFMFSSFFGFSSVTSDMNEFTMSWLPKPIFDTNKNSLLMGISIPSVLLISLGMGVLQLMASNACKAYQEFRYGRIIDGIFFGLIWVVFLGGFLALAIGLVVNDGMIIKVGAIVAVASLLVAMCTAGIRVKGFGKFTKAFGALYGIINYLSDILSYARLYGLMLSGAIIAQIVSGQGWALVVSGNVAFAVIGIVVLIIGHAFNLAMGLLGGYIHDARLQYIEFFSRFYTGEGELFAPLGSKRKYINLIG